MSTATAEPSTEPSTVFQPATVSQTGKAPKTRFTSASAVWSSYQNALTESLKNDVRLTDVRAIYDGAPLELGDISNQQLANAGDLPNINLRRFTSKIQSYVGNFTQLDCGADSIADIKVKIKHTESPTQKTLWEMQLTQFFSEAIAEWDPDCNSIADYVMESTVRNIQMALFGIGCAFFRDEWDWRFIAIPTRSVRVPNGTKITLRNHSATFVNRTYTATELWEKRKFKGWNEQVVIEFLYWRLAEGQQGAGGERMTLAAWQNWLRNNETYYQRDFRQIQLVEAFVQEFSDTRDPNGVSKYVIGEYNQTQDFLYKGERAYKSISHVIIPFTDDPSPEGDWHGVKGYGDQIFDTCHFQNLYWNHMATMALLASTPMFTSASQEDRNKLSQIVWSRLGVITPGLTLNGVKMPTDISGCEAVFESSSRILNEISRTYPVGETVGARTKTATQETFDRQDESQMTSLQIAVYRSVGLDRLFTEMYRRLTRKDYPEVMPGGKAAKNFREKCKAGGIPPECYQDPQSVRANRKGSTGNNALDVQKAMATLKQATPGMGQQSAKKLIVGLLQGFDQVPAYIQDVPPQDSDDEAMTLENALLSLGQLTTAQSYQNHPKHLGSPDPNGPGHLSLLAATRAAVMQIQQQGVKQHLEDAQKLSRTMDATVRHSQEHLNYLQQMLEQNTDDAELKNLVKQLAQVLNTFVKFAGEFDRQVAKASMEQQQQAPQMAVEDQIKLDKWNVEKQIMLQKAQIEMQLHEQSQNLKLGQIAERSAAKMHFSEQEHLQKLGNMGESTLLDNQITKVQAGVDAAAQMQQNLQQTHHNAVSNAQELAQTSQQHEQEMQQSQAEHDQNIAQTRAEHNVKLEQQSTEPTDPGE